MVTGVSTIGRRILPTQVPSKNVSDGHAYNLAVVSLGFAGLTGLYTGSNTLRSPEEGNRGTTPTANNFCLSIQLVFWYNVNTRNAITFNTDISPSF